MKKERIHRVITCGFIIPVLIMSTLMLSGCWDSVEVNDRYIILELAIDKNQTIDPGAKPAEKDRYKVTYSIPDISKLSGSESLLEDVKSIIKVSSPSIVSSIDDLEAKTQNTVTFSHTKALILGEELLRDKKLFRAAMDSITRKRFLARSTPVFGTKETAAKIVEASSPQNPIIGLYVMKYVNNVERPVSYAEEQLLGNFIKEMEGSGVSVIPLINMDKEGQIEISSGALIKDYELVTFLNKDEMRGKLLIEGAVKEAPIVIMYNDEYLTYVVQKQKSQMKFKESDGQMVCSIELMLKGNITEYVSQEERNIFDKGTVDAVEKILEKEIVSQAQIALDKAKAYNVDFLNIGRMFYRKHPKKWQKYKDSWEADGFKEFPVEITAKVDVDGTGVLE